MNWTKFICAYTVIAIIMLIGFVSCKQKESMPDKQPTKVLSQDFEEFFEKFHTDTAFQMSRIIFPLEGKPTRPDSTFVVPPDFRWQKEDWLIHKPFDDMNGTFSRSFINVNNIIIEHISDASGQYNMERRFAKLSGDWHLIYYKEMSRD